MKTTILADGTLSVTPESDLEAYALNKWCKDNLDFRAAALHQMPKIIIDCSEYAERLGEFVTIPGKLRG